MRRLLLLPIVVGLLIGGCGLAPSGRATPSTSAKLEIFFDIDSSTFPDDWDVTVAEPVPKMRRERAMKIINAALSEYPQDVIDANLKRIYVLEDMAFDDVPYGGTYDGYSKTLYVLYLPYMPEELERTIHHEFASLLIMWNPPSFTGKWSVLNRYMDYAYDDSSFKALQNEQMTTEYNPKLYPLGFLNTYSSAHPEEDFDCIVEGMFTGGEEFWKIVDGHPPIKAKVQQAVEFLSSLNPQLNEKYLRSLKPVVE